MQKVLIVDDEKNILDAYRRNLQENFDLSTAVSGMEAIEILKTGKLFTVIVSDYKMPVMNGVELLDQVRILSPETVQIMLTGQADMNAVIDLLNKGSIFRFLTKPCTSEDLVKNINDGIRQYELVTAERDLLGKTLGGSIRVLTDLLALAKPQAFHRAQRIRNHIKKISMVINKEDYWQIEIAAMLSQIGCVTMPDEILKKAYGGRMLTEYEMVMFQNHPLVAAEMIQNIPRMERIAEIIKYQEKNFNGKGIPTDEISGSAIPTGARFLKIILDYDRLLNAGKEPDTAFSIMKKKDDIYDQALLQKITEILIKGDVKSRKFINKELSIKHLTEEMYLAEDVISAEGVILGSINQKVSRALIITLKNYEINKQIKDPIKVLVVAE